MTEWSTKEPGKFEVFTGTIKAFFPRHNERELTFLKEKWGKFRFMCMPKITGKPCETWNGPGTHLLAPHALLTQTYHQIEEVTHFGPIFVPLEEIRDYFGDHVGMYNAWLVLYTRYLVWLKKIVALYYLSFTLYQIHEHMWYLCS